MTRRKLWSVALAAVAVLATTGSAFAQQGGQGTEQAGRGRTLREQRGGGVLALQADAQRVDAGGEGGTFLGGGGLGLAQLAAPAGDLLERGDGLLVTAVQAELAVVEAGDPRLQGGERERGLLGAAFRLPPGRGQPLELGSGRLAAAGTDGGAGLRAPRAGARRHGARGGRGRRPRDGGGPAGVEHGGSRIGGEGWRVATARR